MESEAGPGQGRMERKKQELRKKIITVAMNLFERQGFGTTTMEQIAEEADIARKTLYNYFPVKEAIADEYVRDVSRGLAEKTFETLGRLPDTRTRLLEALNNAYGWVEVNPEITGVVLAYRFKTSYQAGKKLEPTGTETVMAEIIRRGQQSGEIEPGISAELMVLYLDMLRGTMVMEWLKNPSGVKLGDRIAQLVDMVLYGISTR